MMTEEVRALCTRDFPLDSAQDVMWGLYTLTTYGPEHVSFPEDVYVDVRRYRTQNAFMTVDRGSLLPSTGDKAVKEMLLLPS